MRMESSKTMIPGRVPKCMDCKCRKKCVILFPKTDRHEKIHISGIVVRV